MRFAFVSGDPVLDLVGTVGSRRDDPVDLLAEPADVERWIEQCPGLPEQVTVDRATFESALCLREAVYRLTLDRMLGRAFDEPSLHVVNATATRPGPTIQLDDTGVQVSGDAGSALAELARSAIALLADPQARLKECGRRGCTRVYLDSSRGGRRTWCGMDECGNRVKAAAYRARRRAAAVEGAPS